MTRTGQIPVVGRHARPHNPAASLLIDGCHSSFLNKTTRSREVTTCLRDAQNYPPPLPRTGNRVNTQSLRPTLDGEKSRSADASPNFFNRSQYPSDTPSCQQFCSPAGDVSLCVCKIWKWPTKDTGFGSLMPNVSQPISIPTNAKPLGLSWTTPRISPRTVSSQTACLK
jgi:hypothetical protein